VATTKAQRAAQAEALAYPFSDRHGGVLVSGCGMDEMRLFLLNAEQQPRWQR
jgi:hypothetical protein